MKLRCLILSSSVFAALTDFAPLSAQTPTAADASKSEGIVQFPFYSVSSEADTCYAGVSADCSF